MKKEIKLFKLEKTKCKKSTIIGIVIMVLLFTWFSINFTTKMMKDEATIENNTPEQIINSTINSQIKKSRIKNISVVELNDVYNVEIEFIASENLSTKLEKSGMHSDMSLLYKKLYETNINISNVIIDVYYPLIDVYGNKSYNVVYVTSLNKIEANKINWNIDLATLKLQVLPGVWDTIYLHDIFK